METKRKYFDRFRQTRTERGIGEKSREHALSREGTFVVSLCAGCPPVEMRWKKGKNKCKFPFSPDLSKKM